MKRLCDGCPQDERGGCPALQANVGMPGYFAVEARQLVCAAVKHKHKLNMEKFNENHR